MERSSAGIEKLGSFPFAFDHLSPLSVKFEVPQMYSIFEFRFVCHAQSSQSIVQCVIGFNGRGTLRTPLKASRRY
jgi:hypothetical protein